MKRSILSLVCTLLLLAIAGSTRAASTFGILINSNRLVAAEDAGESPDGYTQYLAHVQLNALDTIRLIDTSNNNATWMVDLDEASVNGFEGGADVGYLVCTIAGCYDCYLKLNPGADQLYIGAGTDGCSEGVEYNPSSGGATGGNDTGQTYYLIGNTAELGAWALEDALLMTDGTITLDLQAGEYKFKVVEGRSWDIALGYASLNFDCSSYNIRDDEDGNVAVVLAQAGTLIVRVQNNMLCVTGSFVNNTDQVRLITQVSPGEAGYASPAGGSYSIGSQVELSANIATGGWMFDRWSDNDSWDNPRTITLTQDTTITAIFSPGEYGLLINGGTVVPGTFTGRVPEGSYIGQFKATTYLQQGDQLQIINLFHGDNSAWRPELEEGGMSGNFAIGDNYLTCNMAGCYDIYIKIHYGQSSDYVYIGESYDCPDQGGNTGGGNTGGDVLFSTTFEDWPSQTYSSEQKWVSSDVEFTLNRVKVVPNQQPASVSGAGVGYIQPTNTSSAYVYTDRLAYVERVLFTHASAVVGGGWQLQSSSDGVDWYAFNDNETGCSSSYQAEQKEVYVFMENVWLRWVPLSGSSNTSIYLTDITIYGNTGSSGAPDIVASGTCADDGSANVTWLLTADSILTIGGDGRMADYDEDTNIAPWYQYKDAYNSVYIAAGVTNVGDLAFRQSNNLRYVDLASTVTELGSYSFYSCPALHTFTLPDNVTTLGENSPFGGTTTMTSPVYNSHVFVCLNSDFTGEYTVASGITTIASHAFRGCSMLTSVVLPSTVTSLPGSSTFENCSALASVNIPEGVTSLGEYAFSGCTSLMGIDLPSTMSSLGSYCLAECSAIDSIVCRATTPPTANGSTFSGVREGTTIYVPGQSIETYLAADGWSTFGMYQALDESAGNMCPVSGTCGVDGNNVLWTLSCDSVLTISGTGAMADYMGSSYVPWSNYSNVIREAVVGSGVTSLSEYSTFENCTALESVILPEGITSLGGYTFSNCTSLKGIDLPSTLTSLGSYCFGDCNAIDSIVSRAMTPPTANGSTFSFAGETVAVYVPEAAMSSYQSADGWSNFSDFRALVLPPLASGYCGAEGDSTNLAWVLGADSVLTITGTGAMANFAGTNQVPWYEYSEAIATADIIEGVTSIGNYAFMNLPNLRIVNLPEGLTRIGQSAFYMCAGLRGINFPGTITEVANGAFDQTSIENPVYNMSIFAYMPKTFSGTYSIPEGVEKIAGYAFESCTLLTSVTIPQSVNSIGGSAFGYCTSLESVNIPDGITYIEGYTFTNCTSLNSIEIPASVNRIANMAFNGCSSLGNIYCRGAYPPADDLQNAFTDIDSTILTVFVPSRSVALYQAADGWKKFSNIRGQDDPNRFTMPISTEWQFIMLPGVTGDQWCGLPMDSILSDSTLVWARYVGNYRAEGRSGWQLFDPAANEARFLCTDAYIVRANGAGATLTMKVPVDAANMTSVTYTYEKHTARHAENANWNFVGNPFPYYYNILAQLDALGITTPITIWNGTGYELFTPGIDTERMLAPFEAFFIQVPEDVESVVITFSGEYIIM